VFALVGNEKLIARKVALHCCIAGSPMDCIKVKFNALLAFRQPFVATAIVPSELFRVCSALGKITKNYILYIIRKSFLTT